MYIYIYIYIYNINKLFHFNLIQIGYPDLKFKKVLAFEEETT